MIGNRKQWLVVASCLLLSPSLASAAWNAPWYHTFGRWIGYGFGDGYHACPDPSWKSRGPAWPHNGEFRMVTPHCPTCAPSMPTPAVPSFGMPTPAVAEPAQTVTKRGLPGLEGPPPRRR